MKYLKFILPNTLTIINLLSGLLAIVFVFEGLPWISIILLLTASLADVLDGLVAKLLNATSEFGKQLDSLSDLVSFGVAPSVFVYGMIKETLFIEEPQFPLLFPNKYIILLGFSFLLAVFAALRLARFNIDNSKSSDFRGLPVPANALFVIAVWITFHPEGNIGIRHFLFTPVFLISLVIVLSFLMISNIPMLSFKFQNLKFKENIWRYILILGSVILFIVGGISYLLYVMLYYIGVSLLKFLTDFFISSKGQIKVE